jgi:hypothetical protein
MGKVAKKLAKNEHTAQNRWLVSFERLQIVFNYVCVKLVMFLKKQ